MFNFKILVAFYFLSCSSIIHAGAYIARCPETIKTIEQIKEPPKGWESLQATENNYLSTVSFYSGHPDKMTSLKPEFATKKQARWEFSSQELIYLVCHYNHSGIKLTQPLPEKTIKCSVTYNLNLLGSNGFLPEHIKCDKQS